MTYLDCGLELINKISDMGYEAYLVGGAIRDLLLNKELHDIDITTSMPIELIEKNFNTEANGKDFYSLTIKYKKYKFEITHFRRDLETLNHRHPIVSDVKTLKEDSFRRDLTINQIAMDKNKNIIDYHNGIDDLNNKIIRMIGNPLKRFDEDALRILRCIYYYTKLDFDFDDETKEAIIKSKELLVYLSNERLFSYFINIFYDNNKKGIQFIKDNNIFEYVLEYKRLADIFDIKYDKDDLVFYYYLKYNSYLKITSKEDKKLCKKLDILINSNFSNYSLYLYKNEYKRLKNVLFNLGYDTKSIDLKIKKLVIKNDSDLRLNNSEMSNIIKSNKKQLFIERVKELILENRINNTKEDIESILNEKIKAYIDSFEYITILLSKDVYEINKEFYLEIDVNNKIKLEIVDFYEENEFFKYVAKFDNRIELHKEYYITDGINRGLLRSGSIIRTLEFENKFKYDGPLGFVYTKEYTDFYIWTPVAKELVLELYNDDVTKRYNLEINELGVWHIRINGDLEGFGYLFYVRVFEELELILDPYAISSAENHKYNYIVDKNKFYKMKYNKPSFSGRYTDSIIYEASIRDMTSEIKGNYLDLVDSPKLDGIPTGIEYIKSLGITHVQLLPTYDFYGVDDNDKNRLYNWGYNPLQYFVPSGWYSEKPNDPYSRINEKLMLIDEFHKNGIRVNLDVVFNHIFMANIHGFEKLLPGYSFRYEPDGRLSNASGCGNVLATERYQNRRFIIDVLKYYATYFNISGFRFDLMGLLDIDTLNEAKTELYKIDNTIMLYGEGWDMHNPLPQELRPTSFNHFKMPGYAFFNDRFRDEIRGSQWGGQRGYAYFNEYNSFNLRHLITGSCLDYYKFNNPNQSINYVECHDNYTFYDFGVRVLRENEYKVLDASRLAIQIVLISLGVPFIHAGEEFFRTKNGVENSYKSRGNVNRFDYARRNKYIDNVKMVSDLISIRKEYSIFRLDNPLEIYKKIHVLDGLLGHKVEAFIFEDTKCDLFVIIKNDYLEINLELLDTTMIFDSFKKVSTKGNNYIVSSPGVYIFRKEK